MSNCKFAYGWSGHIIASRGEVDSNPDHNLVAINPSIFEALVNAYENDTVDERIEVEQLGVTDGDVCLLATGSCFSEGFTHYGTVFVEAENRIDPGPAYIDHDAEYLKAMKDIYKLELPPCRLMIGCASEH